MIIGPANYIIKVVEHYVTILEGLTGDGVKEEVHNRHVEHTYKETD